MKVYVICQNNDPYGYRVVALAASEKVAEVFIARREENGEACFHIGTYDLLGDETL